MSIKSGCKVGIVCVDGQLERCDRYVEVSYLDLHNMPKLGRYVPNVNCSAPNTLIPAEYLPCYCQLPVLSMYHKMAATLPGLGTLDSGC